MSKIRGTINLPDAPVGDVYTDSGVFSPPSISIGGTVVGGGANRLLFIDKNGKLGVSTKLIVSDDTTPGTNTNFGVLGVNTGVFLMADNSTANNIEEGPWLGGIIQDDTAYPNTKIFLFGPSGEPDFTFMNGATTHGSSPHWPSGIPDTVFHIGGQLPSTGTRLKITGQSDTDNTYVINCTNHAQTRSLLYVRSDGVIGIDATNTAPGTTGAQTINKAAGKVNFAAAATSLTVTNAICQTSSIPFCSLLTDDATARLGAVVPGNGNFVIHMEVAPTAEVAVGWWIIN